LIFGFSGLFGFAWEVSWAIAVQKSDKAAVMSSLIMATGEGYELIFAVSLIRIQIS
jgi:hypothetical protein